ncbi:MAG: HflK protein, partial [Desulfamplus sp.]|nr:HflK protein [Desulfamplus sp.]
AMGDASRFTSVYQEYVKAKDVTETRLYLEAMLEIIPRIGKKYGND